MEEMDQEVFKEYLAETFESLDGLDQRFVQLEKSPEDIKIIDSIFRPVHSIKGSAAFFGLNHVKNFSHKLENLLDDLRKGKKKVTQAIIDNLLKGTDFLKGMFHRVAEGDATHELTQEENDFINTLETRILEAEGEKPATPDYYLFKMETLLKQLFETDMGKSEQLAELAKNLEMLQMLLGIKEPEVKKLGDILAASGVDKGKIEESVAKKSPEDKVGETLIREGLATKEMVEKAIITQSKQAKEAEKLQAIVKKTMRIAEEKVDEFMDQIGELVIISEVFNYLEKRLSTIPGSTVISKEFKNANLNFSELTLRLQHGLSEVRKVSIKGIFQKLPRVVRDLATSIGKQVDIELVGEDIMLDKSLLEKLESPIIHMVRNGVDHGIEKPETRKAKGKPVSGKLVLSAEVEGETLILKLIDDGAGLSRTRIGARAVEKGIVTPQTLETLSDRDVFEFIFHPGFSTAEKITDVSGRGVGMDVVKSAIAETKGKIDILSEEGKGSSFIISLPISTTLVTINGLIVAVGKGKFIFPVEDVKESIRPTGKELFTVKDQTEMINIRGNIYPLIRLHRRFGITTRTTDPCDGVGLIIEKNGLSCCAMADSIVEQQNVVLKDLGRIFRSVKSITGGAILGDGSIGLVINVDGLLEGN